MFNYKRLGLKGKVKIKFRRGTRNDSLFAGFWIPAWIVGEYEKFIVVEILPHMNPYECFGESKPYTMSIHKKEIYDDNVLIIQE